MRATPAADAIAELRQRRRDMRRELARVRWWRRLVAARRELVVGYLASPTDAVAAGLDLSWEALAADAPTSSELTGALWPARERQEAGTLDALDDLDARLESYEARVASALDNVTGQMVRAMADVHRRESTMED